MKHRTHDGSTFLHHSPCPQCGSRDNAAVYTDGHVYCFGCGYHKRGDGAEGAPKERKPVPADLILNGEIAGLPARKITEDTCRTFGYKTVMLKGSKVQVAPYYDESGALIAQKIRTKDKQFSWRGDQSEALPFGAQAWPKQGRMLCVTEGEIDAMALSQVQGNQWPVVSIACGAGPQIRKYIARHLSYFQGFDKVVLMFDNDEPGVKAAREAAEVIGARAHIASIPQPHKDAGDMLLAGKTKELINVMWGAQRYRPEGIVDLAALKDEIRQRPVEGLSWCLPTLTKLTYGKRLGEIAALGAGTGVGKTDFLTQDMLHMIRTHQQKIGIFALEQKPAETGIRLVGKAAEKPLHVPEYWDENVFDSTWDALVQEGRVYLYDSFGVNEWLPIKEKIEYLYHTEGVQYFYLDHLTALAAAEENEKEGLEQIMASMGGLVKAIPIHITFVSHLATPDGKPHEEGGRVTIRHFKGSRAIGFWSHFMFGMERNQQADDEVERKTTVFRVLKDRYTGRAAGEVFHLGYDHDKGILFETQAPDAGKAHGFKDESNGDF